MHRDLRALLWATFLGAADLVRAVEPALVRQVAVIGAGAAGSSTAYFLRKFADEDGVAVNITLFEKTDRIGGRSLTVDPFGNTSQRVELGASIFIAENYILTDAAREFRLPLREPYDDDVIPLMGIWDGDEFVLTVDTSNSWWMTLKILWKYGVTSPRATQKLVASSVAKFLKLYDKEYFPFRSLTQRVYDLELAALTGSTGEQLLKANGISDLYAHDIIQASTRVNYASNLGRIHGLDTMVSMAPEGAVRVDGGNWLIFALMAAKSGAHISLNTSVTALSLVEQKASSSPSDKYIVTTRSAESGIEENLPVAFDNIVVATPFQFSDIATSAHVIQATIDEIPYVKLHVTILSSPLPLSPAFFNLAATASVPGMILTTLGKNDNATSGSQGAGAAGFFSINVLRTVVNPATQRPEYLYKIFSPDAVSVEFLSRLFGVAVDEDQLARADASGTRRSGSQEGQQREDAADAARAGPVSWFFPAVFDSYPQALPRVTFQDPVVGAGVYYTSGMESFISTMETNALMGKNVARLIVDEILDAARTEMQAQAGNKKPGEDWTAAERQKVLGAGPPR